MKKLFIANWKSHKTIQEALSFMKDLELKLAARDLAEKEIVICSSFTSLPACSEYISSKGLPVALGAQNVSEFEEGAYTGEVNAKQLKELCSYVIIGHSERREHFGETDDVVEKKVARALASGLTPIVCIQDEHTPIPAGVSWVAYEPVFAIGTGTPDTPENIQKVFNALLTKYPTIQLLYGGSVKEDNVKTLISIQGLCGFLVGGASLSADSFVSLLS